MPDNAPHEALRFAIARQLEAGAHVPEVTAETLFYVKFGLAGYGPDLEPDDEPVTLEHLDSVIEADLDRAAEQAYQAAESHADAGDFEQAWKEHKRSEHLSALAANFNPARRNAPAYAGRPELWLAAVYHQLADFPVDVGNHERLYVWEAETDG